MSSADRRLSEAGVAVAVPPASLLEGGRGDSAPEQAIDPPQGPPVTPEASRAVQGPGRDGLMIVGGFLALLIGFGATMIIPAIKAVVLGHIAIAAAMGLMLLGAGLVVFGVVRNSIRNL